MLVRKRLQVKDEPWDGAVLEWQLCNMLDGESDKRMVAQTLVVAPFGAKGERTLCVHQSQDPRWNGNVHSIESAHRRAGCIEVCGQGLLCLGEALQRAAKRIVTMIVVRSPVT